MIAQGLRRGEKEDRSDLVGSKQESKKKFGF